MMRKFGAPDFPVFCAAIILMSSFSGAARAQTNDANAPSTALSPVWQVPNSRNLMPHFESANGRKVLYVDGSPFTALAVEIPWWDLIYGRYQETETAYDDLYPAATELGLNAL